MFRFVDYCREELGLSSKNMEKDVFEDIVLQSELLSGMEQVADIHPDNIETLKDIYGYLVFDLGINNGNIKFTANGFHAYTGKQQTDTNCFLKYIIDQQQSYLILNRGYASKGFDQQIIDGQSALVLKSVERKKIENHFSVIKKLITESLNEVKYQNDIHA